MAGLAASLIVNKRITTTEAKAKELRPLAEKLVTLAKRDDLHSRRQVVAMIGSKPAMRVLFEDIAKAAADRNGGYTRIVKIGQRQGDAAPMALIEFIDV